VPTPECECSPATSSAGSVDLLPAIGDKRANPLRVRCVQVQPNVRPRQDVLAASTDGPHVHRRRSNPRKMANRSSVLGLIVSTAVRAAVSDIQRFRSGRHLSCRLGLTAREHSSGERRRLGPISKQGDVYSENTTYSRRTRGSVSSQECCRQGSRARSAAPPGARDREACRPQQGSDRAGEQAGPHYVVGWKHERTFEGGYARRSSGGYASGV